MDLKGKRRGFSFVLFQKTISGTLATINSYMNTWTICNALLHWINFTFWNLPNSHVSSLPPWVFLSGRRRGVRKRAPGCVRLSLLQPGILSTTNSVFCLYLKPTDLQALKCREEDAEETHPAHSFPSPSSSSYSIAYIKRSSAGWTQSLGCKSPCNFASCRSSECAVLSVDKGWK